GGADLAEANLRGANLQNAKNLTPSQLEQGAGDASTILPEHLEGSVSWSPAKSEAARNAPMRVPSFVVPRAAKFRSLRPLLWIAGGAGVVAFAAVAWWQYGGGDGNTLSIIEWRPAELKVSHLPASPVLRPIDQPDAAFVARGEGPTMPTVVASWPAAYADL